MAQLATDDVFALLQNAPLGDEGQVGSESVINFDDFAQNHTEIQNPTEVQRVPEQVIDSQEVERKNQLEMRQELESWAKNLLHLIKDLDEPGKSAIADNYIKVVRDGVRQFPEAPSRTELRQITTRKQVKVNRSFIPADPIATGTKPKKPKEPQKMTIFRFSG